MNAAELERMGRLEEQHFWFRARRRDLRPWLTEAFAQAPPGPALDLGAGTGRNLELLEEFRGPRHVIGIDRSPVALSHCAQRPRGAALLRAEASRLPFASASIALITALDVLEHVQDEEAALAELARCALPGAELIVTVPAHPELYSHHDRALGHLRRYRRLELDFKLEERGFDVVESRSFNRLLLPLVASWRRVQSRRKTGPNAKSDVRPLPGILNAVLGTILSLEASFPRSWKEFSGLSWWIRAKRRT